MIIITSHASLIDGKIYDALTNNFIEILQKNKMDFIFIRHSIDGNLPSTIYNYHKGKNISRKNLVVFSKIAPLRYISEIISTFIYFLHKKYDVRICYIGVDPLNAFTGVLLKKVSKIDKVIFYTADYSKKRFSNKILNYLYHTVDRYCVKNVDEVWNVSSRIRDVRKNMGLIDSKNIFLPNVPSDEYKNYTTNKKNKYHLITLGVIGDQLDFIGIFDSIKDLKIKFPQILLTIVGNGPKEEEYIQYVKINGLENNVKFLGYLSHNQALEEISKSGIGLALYNGNWNFNYYGDSVKCREYFSFGLPVITTDSHSTVEEIKENQAGIVCNMNKDDYIRAILEIIGNYEKYSRNSYCLSQKYENIHSRLLKSMDNK